MPDSALEAVAGDRSRVLSSDRSPGRLPCSLHGLSSSPFSHPGIVSDVPGRLSSGSSLAARGRGDACQRSLRNRPRSGSWLLQSPFPGGEGVWRPVIDLSHLNEFVHLTRFKMETVASVLLSVREGDFLAYLDLNDAYFQISIHRSSRKLLRFTSEGTVYQFRALCFGLSTAPQVFIRVFVSVGTLPQDQTSLVPGRLVDSCLFGAGSQAVSPVAALALSHPWDCDKREEVGSCALADCEVSRHDH